MIAGAASGDERGDQQWGEGTTAGERWQVHGVCDWRSSDRLERGGKRGTVRSGAVSRQGSVPREPFTAGVGESGLPGGRGANEIRLSFARRRLGTAEIVMPLGVTGNTPASGAGESWFDPRRGNCNARIGLRRCGRLHRIVGSANGYVVTL